MANDIATTITPVAVTEVSVTISDAGAMLSLGVTQSGFSATGEPTGPATKVWHGTFALSPHAVFALKKVIDTVAEHFGGASGTSAIELVVQSANKK